MIAARANIVAATQIVQRTTSGNIFADYTFTEGRLKGLRHVCLRYFNAAGYDPDGEIQGLEQNPANLLPVVMETAMGWRAKLQIFGDDYSTRDGTGIRDYVHVSDLASAHVAALEHLMKGGENLTLNLGTGSGITVKEMVHKAMEVTGRRIPFEIAERRLGDPASVTASSELAHARLGWTARHSDVETLGALCQARGVELNVEGYPTREFMDVVIAARPAQCTLVPDEPGQLTSDHGWDLRRHEKQLREVIAELSAHGIRSSLFVDYDNADIPFARELGADRVELYTEPYAETYGQPENAAIWQGFADAAKLAQDAGLGVNAGHDLNLENLGRFLQIPGILEVSIGHAIVVECLEMGVQQVMQAYQSIIQAAA